MKWLYSLYSLKVTHKLDKEALVASILLNKPEKYLSQAENSLVNDLQTHFSDLGYFVIVR